MTAIETKAVVGVGVAVAAVAVVGFAVAEALDLAWSVDPSPHMDPGAVGAVIGAGLLVADIALPVPSSIVMVAHGALFGVVPGAALSLAGRTGNAAAGVLLGRYAGSWLARRSSVETARGTTLIDRWGLFAVVLTRPLPVLAESTVVAAGAAGLPAPAVIGAAAVGAVPEAVLYAIAGAAAGSSASLVVVFLSVGALAVATAAVTAWRARTPRAPAA